MQAMAAKNWLLALRVRRGMGSKPCVPPRSKTAARLRAIRTMGEHFDWQIDTLSAYQLTNYFHQHIASHS